jgi:hypothetical protein
MPSNIKVISPYIEQNGGDSVLSAIKLSSQNSIKEISLDLSLTSSNENFTISLSGSTGSISLGPKSLAPNNILGAGQRVTNFIRTSSDAYSTDIMFGTSAGNIVSSSGVSLTSVNFSKDSFTEKTTRDISQLFNVNYDGEYIAAPNKNPLISNRTSFSLLRTNPKLTGNVKLTVDSNAEIWLNSIDATKDLADSRFKKVPVNYQSNYVIDIRNFFDYGQTPNEIVYALHEESSSYFSTQRKLNAQYDRFYCYGAQQLIDKSYSEDFTFFAPLRIDNTLPEYFVIFRTDGAFNPFTYSSDVSEWKSNVNSEILNKSSIVKTFDLTENSKIGKYIRNLIQHPSRKEAEMTVSFQSDGYTTFNGIDFRKGSFSQKGELLSDFYATPNTLLGTEEFLSLGFTRNSLLSSSILNLEFLFDDADAEDYTINRYFGLYLATNQLADFFLSEKALEQFSSKVGQLPIPRIGVQGNKFSTKSFVQTNPNGIKLYVDTDSVSRNDKTDVFNTIVSEVLSSTSVCFPGEWIENPYLNVGDRIIFSNDEFSFGATVTNLTQSLNKGIIEFSPGYTGSNSLLNTKADFSTPDKIYDRNLSIFENSNIADTPRIFYVQDKNGEFYHVSGSSTVQTKIDAQTYRFDTQLALVDRKIDISNFSGSNQMLTQTEATVYSTKGSATLEMSIEDAFQTGDTVEISWYLPTYTEPMRWVIQASASYLLPGEVWPDSQILEDIDGTKFYYTIFHPGVSGDTTQIAQTIKKGFDTFPFKLFNVSTENNKVFFKSTVEGEASNNLSLTLDINNSNIKSFGFNAPIGRSSLNFMGGTDFPKRRAKIARDIAEGILPDEYFKTIGSFCKLKQFDVWGNTVMFAPSLESPVYVNDILQDYEDKYSHAIIELNENTKFDLTFDNKITSYNLNRGKFGLFSIFPIRDFDTDYFSSDYTKNYNPELLHYFQNSGKYGIVSVDIMSKEVILDRPYEPTGVTGSFMVPFIGVYDSGKTPKDYNGLVQLYFSEPGLTSTAVYYKGPAGSWNLFDSEKISLGVLGAPESIVPLPEDKILFFEEDMLSKFKGFFSLSSIVSEQDMKKFSYEESQWNFNRFLQGGINSEYLRSYENFTTEYALTSKVVPYICKWVSLDGKDVRGNPYRFNYNRAFGTMNFSPSANYPMPDTRYHTHEWSYLANVPYHVDPVKYSSLMFSYFFDKPLVNYDFDSITRDWFSEYFTVGYPTELFYENDQYVRVPVETDERYSIFKFDTLTEKTYTMFRGVRIEIGELIPDGSNVIGSEKYVDYKFSSVIVPIDEQDGSYHEPLEFEIIVNEKFKFILNLIKVYVSSYKNPEGNISYVDLYTLQNRRDKATYKFEDTKIFTPSPGVVAFNYNKGIPSDVLLKGPVNLVNGYPISPNWIDTSTVNPLLNGIYSYLYGYKNATAQTEYTATSQLLTSVNDTRLIISSGDTYVFNPVLQFSLNGSGYGTTEWIQYTSYYASGGDNYYSQLRNYLSFYEISRILEGKSDKIIPIKRKISINGSVSEDISISFAIISPEQVYQSKDIIPVPDEDKPSQLYSESLIGMELTTYSDPQFLYRYQGDFIPKFKDIFHFASREDKNMSLLYNNDFRLGQTFILDSISDSYFLYNQFFNKVADEEILRIPSNSGYKSLYPAVDEISIDKKNMFIWNSSWDNDFYRKYTTVSNFTDVKGTEEMTEVKSLFGSKMMKLPKSYSLYEFLTSEYTYDENNAINTQIISSSVSSDFLTVDIDLYARLLRELKGTEFEINARREFLNIATLYPDVISLNDVDKKVDEYLKANVMKLYEVTRVNFYFLETGSSGSDRPIIQTSTVDNKIVTLSEKSLYANMYKLKKDVKTNISNDLKVQLQITLDSRFYTSIGFGIDISRI